MDRILAQLGFVLPLTSCFVTEGGAGVELRSLVMVAQSVERHTCMHTHIPHDLIALCNAFLSLSQTAVFRKQSGRRGEKSSFPVCSNAMHWERSLTHARGKIMRYFLPLMWLKQTNKKSWTSILKLTVRAPRTLIGTLLHFTEICLTSLCDFHIRIQCSGFSAVCFSREMEQKENSALASD